MASVLCKCSYSERCALAKAIYNLVARKARFPRWSQRRATANLPMKQFSYQKYYSLCRFNYVRLSFNYVCQSFSYVRLSFNYVCLSFNYYISSRFNYVFLSFNYYISSYLLDVQLCSILSFNYYFLSLNYPWSFSHLIVTVCHAISYFMNFTELWLVAIQLFNMDSISTDRLYLSPQKHRWLLTDVFAQASLRLSCTKFENGVEGNFRCE